MWAGDVRWWLAGDQDPLAQWIDDPDGSFVLTVLRRLDATERLLAEQNREIRARSAEIVILRRELECVRSEAVP